MGIRVRKRPIFLCKRGLLINLHRVDFIDEFGNLILSSGEKIFLSELIVKRVKEKLLEYWSNNI